MEELCFLHGLPRGYNQVTRSVDSPVWDSVKRGLEPGGRGIVTYGSITKKHPVTD
jgi:hypothetical protein